MRKIYSMFGRVLNSESWIIMAAMSMFGSSVTAQCVGEWVRGFAAPGTNGSINAIVVLTGGDLIVGGEFTSAGGVAGRNNVARYNPATGAWSAMGSGTNGYVTAMVVVPSGDVIVSGSFSSAGGVALTNNIAKYNPATNGWSPLGRGAGGGVAALAVAPNGDILVGGSFSSVSNTNRLVAAMNIARFSFASGWSAVGSGRPYDILAMTMVPEGDLVVAGGGVLLGESRIARCHLATNTWTSLGTGMNNQILALATLPDGDVVVGGTFTTVREQAISRIARLDSLTDSWVSLGGGTNGLVDGLAILSGGDVMVGGSFTMAGGEGIGFGVARYSPTNEEWSALGSGTSGVVSTFLALAGDRVILGGQFITAGGAPANQIARYDFTGAGPLIVEQPVDTQACESNSVTLTVIATSATSYRWRRNAAPLDLAIYPSAGTTNLTLAHLTSADAGLYDCVISNSCGSQLSAAALLTVGGCCPADFNADGFLDFFDYDAYVTCFETGACPENRTADFNGDDFVDFFDYSDFVAAFETGC